MNYRDLSLLKKVGLALCVGMILITSTFGQCSNSLATRTYDTSLTSNGFNIFSLSFPKWSPDSGLLVSVKMAAEVSSQYGFTLRNADTQPATYQLSIGQEDQFSGPPLTPFTNITPPRTIGSYPLSPGQSVTQGPFTFLDKHLASDSLTAVAPFLGDGEVNISYMSFTYTNLSANNNATTYYYYYGATIANTMHFSLQYLYCSSAGVLAANLTRWTARLQAPRTVQLEWSAVNEAPGRLYHIQRSSDGLSFTDIAALQAEADNPVRDYTWSDLLPNGSAGNFFYRLQIDDNGSVSYSAVRRLSLAADFQGIKVYPNPALDFINLTPGQLTPGQFTPEPVTQGQATAGDWQVDIPSANGSLIQSETFRQAHTMHLVFRGKMSAGTHFVRALDLQWHRNFTNSFIMTRGT